MTQRLSVRLVGPYRGVSGYDRLVRGFARGLVEAGAAVQLEGVAGWSPDLPPSDRDPWFEALAGDRRPADVTLHVLMPDRCRPVTSSVNVNYTMFEASRLPPTWVERATEHAAVVVPTDACRAVWVAGGVPAAKVHVCGQAVDGEFLASPAPPLDLVGPGGRRVATYRRRFLHVGEIRPRKNHLGLLRAWLRATRRHDDAILLLRLRSSAHGFESFAVDVREMERRVGRRLEDAAPVLVLRQLLDDRGMRSLYRSATHYINLSHGEGWDLPMMEAAAAGLSLVAPEYGVYRDYLGPEDAHWIRAGEADAVPDGATGREDFVYFEGARWGQPDEDAAVRAIEEIVASDVRRLPPTDAIVSHFTWRRAGQDLAAVLGSVLASEGSTGTA